MKLFLFFAFILSLTACTGRRYADDKKDPSYQAGSYGLPTPNQARAGNNDIAGENRGNNYGNIDPAAGLLLAGIDLAFNRDYYKGIAITGKCICKNKLNDTIDFPCNNVEVALTDPKGKTLAQIQPRDGEFAFRVPKDKEFRVIIKSPNYRMKSEMSQALRQGDDIILTLFKK
jgi:hypothetical protein